MPPPVSVASSTCGNLNSATAGCRQLFTWPLVFSMQPRVPPVVMQVPWVGLPSPYGIRSSGRCGAATAMMCGLCHPVCQRAKMQVEPGSRGPVGPPPGRKCSAVLCVLATVPASMLAASGSVGCWRRACASAELLGTCHLHVHDCCGRILVHVLFPCLASIICASPILCVCVSFIMCVCHPSCLCQGLAMAR